MMLEKMDSFFDSRLDTYESHMLNNIESAEEFYAFTADCLPELPGAKVLDLGCGTGLEMDAFFLRNPTAQITGIDLAPGMLAAFREKHPNKKLNLICGNYFDTDLGKRYFEAAVSVESLHHFTVEEKIPLYTKIREALTDNGYFILTDYFALSEEEERQCRETYLQLKAEQGLDEKIFYHYDTPLTVEHECQALERAGFTAVKSLNCWGATYTIRADK